MARGRRSVIPAATRGALGAVRAMVCLAFLTQVLLTSFQDLGHLPVTLYAPPGVMRFLPWSVVDWLFTDTGMLLLKVAMVCTLLFGMIGYLTRTSLVLALGLQVIYQGILRGFGHFNHDEMAGLIILGILACAPSGDGFAVDRLGGRSGAAIPRKRYGYPIVMAQAVIAWVYCTAGLLKLRLSGLAYFEQDQLPVLAIKQSLDNLHDTAFKAAFLLPHLGVLLSAATLVTVLWEVFFPVGVLWRKTRVAYLITGLVFHLTTMVLMNITFWNMMAMYLVFVNWPRVGDWLLTRRSRGLGWIQRLHRWASVPELFPDARPCADESAAGVLWWDGTCGFCGKMVQRLNTFVRRPIRAEPFQLVEGLPEAIRPWTSRQMHWWAPDTGVVGGSRALVEVLRAGGRTVMAGFLSLPPVRPFTWLGYRLVASNRDALGPLAGAACEVPSKVVSR